MAVPPRRTGAPTLKRQAVEADVLRATEALLAGGERFADLAVERIATEAGLSRTAFYFYFSDKRELLMRLSDDVMSELYEAAEGWWGGGALAGALGRISELFRGHGPLIRAVIEAGAVDAQVGAFWREIIGRFVGATERHLRDEQAAGRLPAGADPASIAFALVWMTESALYESIAQDDPVDPDRLVESLLHIFTRALSG